MNSVKVSSWITFAWIKLDFKVLCFLLIQINTLGHQNLKKNFLDYNTFKCILDWVVYLTVLCHRPYLVSFCCSAIPTSCYISNVFFTCRCTE